MAHVQFTDVQDRPLECLDLTSLTLDEFQQLLPPFEDAFQAHMAAWQTPPRHPFHQLGLKPTGFPRGKTGVV